MNYKKGLIFLLSIIFLSSLVMAQDYKIEVSTAQESFEAGENITFRVSLFDSQNNPVNDGVFVVLEDAERNIRVEKTIPSNEFVEINLGEWASYGQGTILAKYYDAEAKGFFIIEINELAKFELHGDTLIVTNIGNTRYTKTIQITIGDTIGTKSPKIDIGKSVSYKLVAPEGIYNIKVSDGKTTLTQGDVRLTGTGKAIGILDESASHGSSITAISPEEESNEMALDYLKRSKFIYVFVVVIFGAMILLVIERRYRKKISK